VTLWVSRHLPRRLRQLRPGQFQPTVGRDDVHGGQVEARGDERDDFALVGDDAQLAFLLVHVDANLLTAAGVGTG
jgi:hypothetical protein